MVIKKLEELFESYKEIENANILISVNIKKINKNKNILKIDIDDGI